MALVRKLLIVAAGVLVVLVVYTGVRTVLFRAPRYDVKAVKPIDVDADLAARHLSEAIRFRTISDREPEKVDWAEFGKFRDWMIQTYPRIAATLEREIIHEHAMLYTWPGSEPGLEPLMLIAHYDVVPLTDPDAWTHPGFDGVIADGYVWGRGALDMKCSFVAILEAVETLLAQGFEPRRTVLLGFGFDEEVGGLGGAAKIAERLKSMGVTPGLVLDEGGAIATGVVPGLERPVAAVGVAEKGYLTLELTARAHPGHSSTPPRRTAVGALCRAIARLEADPFPADLTHVRRMFEGIGPYMSLPYRFLFANMPLFSPLIRTFLEKDPQMAASIRTTVAPTMLDAGVKENVLPDSAQAVVNFRILPGQTIEDVVNRVRTVIDDPEVEVAIRDTPDAPSPVSSTDSGAFKLLRNSILGMPGNEDVVVAPYLAVGAADARHYAGAAKNVVRFLPCHVSAEDLKTIHGIDERISVKSMGDMVRFYGQLIIDGNNWPGNL